MAATAGMSHCVADLLVPPGSHRAAQLGVQSFYGVGYWNEDGRCGRPAASLRCGVCCEHPGQRHREHEGVGRPMRTMSCELELVAGRLYD